MAKTKTDPTDAPPTPAHDDPADRKGSGVRRYRVLRAHAEPNFVMIDLEFDTLDRAEAFVRTMERLWSGPGRAVTVSQNARSCSRRRPGGLPAMIAPLIPPMDTPATQSGSRPASCKAS